MNCELGRLVKSGHVSGVRKVNSSGGNVGSKGF